MRHFFILLFPLLFFRCYAGDTLTRAQVYSFNVGDTFDYRVVDSQVLQEGNLYSVTYSRYTISKIYWSPDSLTKYIVRQQLYPAPLQYDTLVLDSPQEYEVVLDTIWFHAAFGEPDTCIVTPLPSYFGRATNYIYFFCCSPGWEQILFAQGLGRVIDYTYGGALGNYSEDSTILIYYSGDSGTYGTPYTSFPTRIQGISSSNEITLFPNPGTGFFTIEVQANIPFPINFYVYDLEGQQVAKAVLNSARQTLDMQELSSGAYIWKAYDGTNFLKSGRVIIQ